MDRHTSIDERHGDVPHKGVKGARSSRDAAVSYLRWLCGPTCSFV